MKRIFLVLLLCVFQIYTAFSRADEKNIFIEAQLKKFEWLKYKNTDGSCSSRIVDEKVIYIDPIDITDEISKIKADIILITHEHSEHFEFNSIVKLLKPSTVILTNANVYKVLKNAGYGKVKPKLTVMKYNDTYGFGGFKVQAVSAINAMKPLYVIPVHWREYDFDDIELLKKNLPSGSNLIILNPNK